MTQFALFATLLVVVVAAFILPPLWLGLRVPKARADRKTANLMRLSPDVIATGNIGCATQIGQRAAVPVVHTVELLDWATGGPAPAALSSLVSPSPVSPGDTDVPHHA